MAEKPIYDLIYHICEYEIFSRTKVQFSERRCKFTVKRRFLLLILTGVISFSSATAYAADSFEGWDDSTKTDAWDVMMVTEWVNIQSRLILDQSSSGAKANVSDAVRAFEDDIREVMEADSTILMVDDAQVELMLAMLQVLGGTNPSQNDPYQITKWFNPDLESVSCKQSINYVLRRLSRAFKQHTNDPYASYSKNDQALQSVIQGVMYGSSYTSEYAEYTLDNSIEYYEAHKGSFEAKEITPLKDFADKVSKLFSTSSITGNGQFAHPCPQSTVSSRFGSRTDPINGGEDQHNGIDFAAPTGTPTYAAADGTVITAGYSSSAGNWVVIDHGNGLVTKYMHHSHIMVNYGDVVHKGQQIGEVGSTGNSTGPHLHFQVELNETPVNPENYL